MGINDFAFGQDGQIITCSSDRTVKNWKINEKTLEEQKIFSLSEFDTTGLKDNVEKQQLGVLLESEKIYSVQCNSDINVWAQDTEQPVETIRGHSNNVTKVVNWCDKLIISGDSDGRILSWNPNTYTASRPTGVYKLPIGIQALACNSKYVYTASADMNVMQFSIEDSGLTSACDLKKKHSSICQMVATDTSLHALFTNGDLHTLDVDDIHTVKQEHKVKDVVCMAQAGDDLWLADKKGFVFTTSMSEDERLKSEYGHPSMSMAASADGSLLAVGDTKGYVTIFDVASKTKKAYFALHQNKILETHFTSDNRVATIGFDKLLCVGTIETQKGIKLSNPNGTALTNSICLFKDSVMTAGYDCAIRRYKF